MPAGERLETDDAVRDGVDLRLVGDAELPTFQGEGELLLDEEPALGLL
jgi:hypothetical protein